MAKRRFNKGPGGFGSDENDTYKSKRASGKNGRMYARVRAESKRKAKFEERVDEFYRNPPPVTLIKGTDTKC